MPSENFSEKFFDSDFHEIFFVEVYICREFGIQLGVFKNSKQLRNK
jgi:hypothetical protein